MAGKPVPMKPVVKIAVGQGGYKRKAVNLSKKELGASGSKAASARTVDIGGTKRITTGALKGKTVGPGGKPLTGSVKMPDGTVAVYRGGKRVTAAPKAAVKPAVKKPARDTHTATPPAKTPSAKKAGAVPNVIQSKPALLGKKQTPPATSATPASRPTAKPTSGKFSGASGSGVDVPIRRKVTPTKISVSAGKRQTRG
jgi:hypothetical protein